MVKFGFIVSLILSLIFPVYAAVDVRVQGSVSAEIASEPGNDFRAGTRIKLYSELVNSGASQIKIRLIGLNQKYGDLNSYDASSWKQLDNLVNWAEVQLSGNLIPQVPAKLSIGNVEIDYSPYTISIKDDLLSDYASTYSNHRGIALRDLKLFGFENSGFVLWGFNNIKKNVVGGKVERQIRNTKISGIILDYRYRVPEAAEEIRNSFENNPALKSELEWEKVTSLEVEQKLSNLGSLRYLVVNLEQSIFERKEQEIENNQQSKVLREIELQKTMGTGIDLRIGYRDFPSDFNPIFRDRTPEFDPNTGHYLGYNPVDQYNDRIGLYTIMTLDAERYKLRIELADMQNHAQNKDRFTRAEFSLLSHVGVWEADLFSRYDQTNLLLNTGVYNLFSKGFTRLILTRQVKLGIVPFVLGLELRKQGDFAESNQQGTAFLRYHKNDLFTLEAGVCQNIKGRTLGGYYCGLNYKAPNGLEFKYRYSSPVVIGDGKKHYDPDYRPLEMGNIAQLSVKIDF